MQAVLDLCLFSEHCQIVSTRELNRMWSKHIFTSNSNWIMDLFQARLRVGDCWEWKDKPKHFWWVNTVSHLNELCFILCVWFYVFLRWVNEAIKLVLVWLNSEGMQFVCLLDYAWRWSRLDPLKLHHKGAVTFNNAKVFYFSHFSQ